MENDNVRGKLQIYSVEDRGPTRATCVVRCVGGIARTGHRFTVNSAPDSSGENMPITLTRIIRYGETVNFVDPPHNAKVDFSGEGVSALARGVIVVAH
ncbi:hypothetical protein GCM10010250_63340 [Streptomyces althioticus]|jgi:hypothetical protein|nr:hypothetical protein GCM10010250_63340 [Streptomyces althioticus]